MNLIAYHVHNLFTIILLHDCYTLDIMSIVQEAHSERGHTMNKSSANKVEYFRDDNTGCYVISVIDIHGIESERYVDGSFKNMLKTLNTVCHHYGIRPIKAQ